MCTTRVSSFPSFKALFLILRIGFRVSTSCGKYQGLVYLDYCLDRFIPFEEENQKGKRFLLKRNAKSFLRRNACARRRTLLKQQLSKDVLTTSTHVHA